MSGTQLTRGHCAIQMETPSQTYRALLPSTARGKSRQQMEVTAEPLSVEAQQRHAEARRKVMDLIRDYERLKKLEGGGAWQRLQPQNNG